MNLKSYNELNMEATVQAVLDCNERSYRYFAVRIDNNAQVGDILPNSWHCVRDCDWVDVDTELDGVACFPMKDSLYECFVDALSWAAVAFGSDDCRRVLLIASHERGVGDLPEGGAGLLREPIVLAVWAAEVGE
jgi:hypothetical protein